MTSVIRGHLRGGVKILTEAATVRPLTPLAKPPDAVDEELAMSSPLPRVLPRFTGPHPAAPPNPLRSSEGVFIPVEPSSVSGGLDESLVTALAAERRALARARSSESAVGWRGSLALTERAEPTRLSVECSGSAASSSAVLA